MLRPIMKHKVISLIIAVISLIAVGVTLTIIDAVNEQLASVLAQKLEVIKETILQGSNTACSSFDSIKNSGTLLNNLSDVPKIESLLQNISENQTQIDEIYTRISKEIEQAISNFDDVKRKTFTKKGKETLSKIEDVLNTLKTKKRELAKLQEKTALIIEEIRQSSNKIIALIKEKDEILSNPKIYHISGSQINEAIGKIQYLLRDMIGNDVKSHDYEEAKRALILTDRYIEDLVAGTQFGYIYKFVYYIVDRNRTGKEEITIYAQKSKGRDEFLKLAIAHNKTVNTKYTLEDIRRLGLRGTVQIDAASQEYNDYLISTKRWVYSAPIEMDKNAVEVYRPTDLGNDIWVSYRTTRQVKAEQ